MDDKFLFLHGDGSDEIGPPPPLCLPKNIVTPVGVHVMTEDQIMTALTSKGTQYTYPLIHQTQVLAQDTILKVAPIPPYFLYDGFEGGLDATLVYERLLRHNDVTDDIFAHLKTFLRACLLSHNTADNNRVPTLRYLR